MILKNCKKDKNYKISIYKYNQSITGDITRYWIEKFNLDNVSEIDDIEKLNLRNLKNLKEVSFKKELGSRRDIGYDGTNDLENIDIISGGTIQSGGSIKVIQNTRFVVKISECELFTAGDSLEINKIPDIFFKKKNLMIMKNLNDNKCLLYCYIRKYLNPITINSSRISKKDIQISKELIDEFNINSENISIIDEEIKKNFDNLSEKEKYVQIVMDINRYTILIVIKKDWILELDMNLMNLFGFEKNIFEEGYYRSTKIPNLDKTKFLKIHCNLVDNKEDNNFLTNIFIKNDIADQVIYENNNIYKRKKILDTCFNYIEVCIKNDRNEDINLKDLFQISLYMSE